MFKVTVTLAALAAATAANAGPVTVNFSSVPGTLGNSHAYTASGLSVTATGLVTGATFFMDSSTAGETWKVYGSNVAGQLGTLLLGGSDESSHSLGSWGQYSFYDFVAGGTMNRWDQYSAGNVLVGGLSLTRAVPESSTWAMMLLGFGAIGFVSRRRARPLAQIA